MAKQKNQRIYSKDHEHLKQLAADQRDYIGRDTQLDLSQNLLTIFALPQKKKQPKKDDKSPRNKRAESAARNS